MSHSITRSPCPSSRLVMPAADSAGRPHGPTALCRSRQSGRYTLLLVTGLVALLTGVGGIVVPLGLRLWEALTPSVVLARGNAGTFASATATPGGFFAAPLSTVQTSVGTLTVTGTFSAPRGSPLAVEEYSQRDAWQLCVVGEPRSCTPLAGTWAGPMAATPAAAHAVAFARHGVSIDHLDNWLALGILGTFLTLLPCAAAVAAREPAAPEPQEPAP